MLITAANSILVLVDLQQKLLPVIWRADAVLGQCLRLAHAARLLGVPVLGTEQNPAGLGHNVEEIRSACEITVSKTHFDACMDGLLEALPPGRNSIVVTGCEAHVCMLQSASGFMAHGYDVWIAADAVGSRKESDRDAALERLGQNGARLTTTEMLVFEWLRSSDHPRFREVLKLIK
jgi:nicotinamidase-related amidase